MVERHRRIRGFSGMKVLDQVRIRALETAEKYALRSPRARKRARIPRVVENSTLRWYLANRAELEAGGVTLTSLTDPQVHHTPLPRCINGSAPESWAWAVNWKPHDRFYLEMRHARLVFEPWRCATAVLSPDGSILHDAVPLFFHAPKANPIRNSVFLGEPLRLKGRAFLLFNDAASNFYHWMCDILPRLHVAITAGQGIDSFDWFITDEISQSFHRETLAALGIPLEKIVVGTRHRHIAPEVLCSTSLYDKSGMVHRESLTFVRNALLKRLSLDSETRMDRRIFITRQEGRWRRIANWEAVETVLEEFDFEIIASEKLELAAQVQLFREASHVIAAHGAGLTNLMFCRPGTKVLEILNEGWGHAMYWLMAKKMDLDYTLMLADAAGIRGLEIDDLVVNPVPLRAYLQSIHETAGSNH